MRESRAAALNPSLTKQLLGILCVSGAAEPGLGNKEHYHYPAALRRSPPTDLRRSQAWKGGSDKFRFLVMSFNVR